MHGHARLQGMQPCQGGHLEGPSGFDRISTEKGVMCKPPRHSRQLHSRSLCPGRQLSLIVGDTEAEDLRHRATLSWSRYIMGVGCGQTSRSSRRLAAVTYGLDSFSFCSWARLRSAAVFADFSCTLLAFSSCSCPSSLAYTPAAMSDPSDATSSLVDYALSAGQLHVIPSRHSACWLHDNRLAPKLKRFALS